MYSTESKLPLYYQVKEQILRKIKSGSWAPDQEIPPEHELMEIYQVSRITIRRALEELVSEGFIFRRRGKGTFVTQKKIEHDLLGDFSFAKQMVQNGMTPSSKKIAYDLIKASGNIQEYLQLPAGTPVHHFERIRLANNEPLILEYAYLPQMLCPEIKTADLGELVLFKLLIEKHQIYCNRSKTSIEPKTASSHEARQLEIDPGTPVLVLEHIIFAENLSVNQPVVYLKRIVRGDRCKIFFQFKGNA